MSSIRTLKKQWLSDSKVKKAYVAMTPEFTLAKTLIAARVKAGLTQQEVAKRMGTTQSAIARLEAGNSLPSMKSLYRYAEATGTTPAIQLLNA
jgi:predicted transcriptional regulator